MPPPPIPTPVLEDDDPVFLHVLRLAGMSIDATDDTLIDCGEGLKVADVKAACYMNRDEYPGDRTIIENRAVRSTMDGWAGSTVVLNGPDGDALLISNQASQPEFGFFYLDDAQEFSELAGWVYLRGYNYDMYASAATACDMLAERMKLQFDFNDGSGNYPRSQKYQMTKQCAADLWKRARPSVVELHRDDTPGGTFWQEVEGEFVAQDWWAWATP